MPEFTSANVIVNVSICLPRLFSTRAIRDILQSACSYTRTTRPLMRCCVIRDEVESRLAGPTTFYFNKR